MENVARFACSIAGVASCWAASAAMNWAFLPWGASGLAKALIIVAFVGSMSLTLSFASIRVFFSRGLVSATFLLFLLFIFFTALEIIYFRFVPDDHEMFRRQTHGILVSPVLAVLALPVLFGGRRQATRRWTRFQALICALVLSASTGALEFVLLCIRGPASGAAYLGIDSSMFSVALLSLVALVAIASLAWPEPTKRAIGAGNHAIGKAPP